MQCTYTYRTEYILYKDCNNSNWRHIILMPHTKLNESVERSMPKTETDSFFRSKKHVKRIWFSVCLYVSKNTRVSNSCHVREKVSKALRIYSQALNEVFACSISDTSFLNNCYCYNCTIFCHHLNELECMNKKNHL